MDKIQHILEKNLQIATGNTSKLKGNMDWSVMIIIEYF